jgi:chromosome segregation ATPase
MDQDQSTIAQHTLEYLRYIRQAVDDLKGDLAGIKLRQTSVEQALLGLRADVVRLEESIFRQTVRIDAMDGKLDRIERRLGLVDEPPS